MIIPVTTPYNFTMSLGIHQLYSPQVTNYFYNNKYRRVLRKDGNVQLFEVENRGSTCYPEIHLRSLIPKEDRISETLLTDFVRALGVDYDLKPLYRKMDMYVETKKLKGVLYGLKHQQAFSSFEAFIIAISEQQISLRAALTLRSRLVKKYGESVLYENQEYFEFPLPSSLQKAKIEDLRALGFSKNKANAIIEITKLSLSGALNELFQMPPKEIVSELIKIKGIGKWTVEYALCKGAGFYELIPTNDLALTAAIQDWYGSDRIRSHKDVEDILFEFAELSGYLAFYFIFYYAYGRIHPQLF